MTLYLIQSLLTAQSAHSALLPVPQPPPPPPPPPAAPPRRLVTVVREKASSRSSFCQVDGDAGEKPMEPTPPSPPSPPTTSPPPVKSNGEGLREAELRLEFERGLHRPQDPDQTAKGWGDIIL